MEIAFFLIAVLLIDLDLVVKRVGSLSLIPYSSVVVRAKLTNPPQLEAECSKISVSWYPFNFSVDIGNADIREYRYVSFLIRLQLVLYTSNIISCFRVELFSGNVTETKTVSVDQVMVDIYREAFTNVKPGENYWAQITPIFFVEAGGGDGYLEDGVPSPPSETVYVPREGGLCKN